MKLRRQQQVERELNGYRAWIDRAGTGQQIDFTSAHLKQLDSSQVTIPPPHDKGLIQILRCKGPGVHRSFWLCGLDTPAPLTV